MTFLLRPLVAAALASLATVAVAAPEPGTHIAFVGERVSVVEVNPCDRDEPMRAGESISEACERVDPGAVGTATTVESEDGQVLEAIRMPPFDHVFKARYRVVEPLAGIVPGPELEFYIADHYGTPAFSAWPNALLVVTLDDGEAYLQKYIASSAHPLRDGGWAVCGPLSLGEHESPPPRELEFARPMRDMRGEDPAWIEEMRAEPDLRVEGNALYCRRGLPVEEALDYLRNGVLKAREVSLEPAPAKS